MLKGIREVFPKIAEDFEKQNADYFVLQNYINTHNAKARGEPVPQPQLPHTGIQPPIMP